MGKGVGQGLGCSVITAVCDIIIEVRLREVHIRYAISIFRLPNNTMMMTVCVVYYRSRSRRGYYDCGVNADLIERFLHTVRTRLPLLVNIEE